MSEGWRRAVRLAGGAVALLAGLWAVIPAVEAEKEVWALCGNLAPGQERGRVEAMFATGTWLRTRVPAGAPERLRVDSPRNLGGTACEVTFAGGVVEGHRYEEGLPTRTVAAAVALPLLAWLVALQSLLAAGAPLGALAWGGAHRRLPGSLRVGSGVSALALCVAAVAVAEDAGWVAVTGDPGMVEGILWAFAALFLLSVPANLLSASRRERWSGAPVALLLALCFVALALGR